MTILRAGLVLLILSIGCAVSLSQEEPKQEPKEPKKIPPRFGYIIDLSTYPQKTPKEAMTSIGKALDRNQISYLLAHLTDPAYVDYWVDRYKADSAQGREEAKVLSAFDRLVRQTQQYYQDDPITLKELRLFVREAEWSDADDQAVGIVKTIPGRKVFLRKLEDRWFLENRQQDNPAGKQ